MNYTTQLVLSSGFAGFLAGVVCTILFVAYAICPPFDDEDEDTKN